MPASPAALVITGAVAGLSIAMPIGPLATLCIQRSLRGGFGHGFSTGLGSTTVNMAYAAILLLGLHHAVLPQGGGGPGLQTAFSVLGGLLLLWSAVRTLRWRPARSGNAAGQLGGYGPAFLSAACLSTVNPLAIVLMLAALSPVLAATEPGACDTAALVCGLGLAEAAWYASVSLGVSLLRRRLRPGLLLGANRVTAGLLGLYAAAALLRGFGA